MERVIDRTAYRRNSTNIKSSRTEEKVKDLKKTKKFLYQLLVSSLIMLFLIIAKIYNAETFLECVKNSINEETNLLQTYEYAKNMFFKVQKYTDDFLNNDVEIDEKIESKSIIQEIVPAVSEGNNIDDDGTFEEAVEGVNQMVDDAQYIKEKYNFKHAIQGTVTSAFGVRKSDNSIVTPYHSGIDVAANKGTNIYAAIGGEVIKATTENAYGKYIMIQTDNIITVYAHCSEIKVKQGQKVKQGDLIGKVGSTGWATGPHLHFEIRIDDRLVNPADVLDYSKMGAT